MLFIGFFLFVLWISFMLYAFIVILRSMQGKGDIHFTLSINTKTSRALRNNNNKHLYSDVFQAYV